MNAKCCKTVPYRLFLMCNFKNIGLCSQRRDMLTLNLQKISIKNVLFMEILMHKFRFVIFIHQMIFPYLGKKEKENCFSLPFYFM